MDECACVQYGGKYIHLAGIRRGAYSKPVTYLAQQLSTKVIVHEPCINPAAIILRKMFTVSKYTCIELGSCMSLRLQDRNGAQSTVQTC